MPNNYILRAELTDAMNRLRDCKKRCRVLDEKVTKMELEIIRLRDELNVKQTSQVDPRGTAGDKGLA